MRYALLTGLILLAASAANVCAQNEDVRFFEQGGITYRESTTTVRQPTREIEYEDKQQTTYREKYDTRMQSVRQYRYAPITQYTWESRVHGRWNLFTGPHMAYYLRPQGSWQLQTRTAQIPVTERRIEQDTRTVKVAVPKLSMQEREVVTRTAVGPAAANRRLAAAPPAQPDQPALAWNLAPRTTYAPAYAWAPPQVAQPQFYVPAYPQVANNYATPGWSYGANGAYGGIARLDGDPPRYGYSAGAPNAGAWQARRSSTESR